ncbi:MAG: hypothetical protein ACI8UO_005152 [Verrucomicrobiales bacterium]|jgi:hypothetical protein
MPEPWTPPYLSLRDALRVFGGFSEMTQSQKHIKPLHQHLALRLVIEGGFFPEELTPQPPLRATKRGAKWLLDFDPEAESGGEQTVLGGLKSKQIDVVVAKQNVGPVLAISVKGTTKALRNLTNRMEEAIGDSTNIHIMYPGLVYGFFQVIRANRFDEPDIERNDIAIGADGEVVDSIRRYHDVLAGLNGRRFVRDDLTRYERVGFAMVDATEENLGEILPAYPAADSPLKTEDFVQSLLDIYDLRYPYMGASMTNLRRVVWSAESPAFRILGSEDDWCEHLGYRPRVGS